MERILKSKYKILDKIFESQIHVSYQGVFVDSENKLSIQIFKREFLDTVLIKKLKKISTELSKTESRLMPKVYDGDYGWQGFYFIRDYIDGKSLGEISCPVDPEEAAKVAVSICEALTVLHDKKIIHGAVTPNNVFITAGGEAYLADA